MKLRDFTVPELDKFRKLCNFTDDELKYFNLRSRDCSNIEIALRMNISEAQVRGSGQAECKSFSGSGQCDKSSGLSRYAEKR